jgi:hypothetical protein
LRLTILYCCWVFSFLIYYICLYPFTYLHYLTNIYLYYISVPSIYLYITSLSILSPSRSSWLRLYYFSLYSFSTFWFAFLDLSWSCPLLDCYIIILISGSCQFLWSILALTLVILTLYLTTIKAALPQPLFSFSLSVPKYLSQQ